MSDSEFLAHLVSQGIILQADGDRLRINAPRGRMTSELQAEIAARKPRLLALLGQAQDAPGAFPPPVEPAPAGAPPVLSLGQERIWAHAQLTQAGPLYNMYLAFRLTGPLDVAVLDQCWAELIDRHTGLRTVFPQVDGRPSPRVVGEAPILLAVWDLSAAAEPEREVQALVQREIRTAFDLTTGPLVRATLARLGVNEHILVLVTHHVVSDGWSWEVLLRELGLLYAHHRRNPGAATPLAPVPVTAADYAAWQQALWHAGAFRPQLEYWGRQLKGAPAEIALPCDGLQGGDAGARHSLLLPAELTARLKALAREQGQTWFITLLTATTAWLHAVTGQRDLWLATPVAGRDRPEVRDLIGYLNNLVVLRLRLDDDPRLTELLTQARRTAVEAFANADVPIHKVLALPGLAQLQLRRFLLTVREGQADTLTLDGIEAVDITPYNESAAFDLSLDFRETGEGLTATFEYRRSLFRAETIARLAVLLNDVLGRVAADPQARLSQVAQATPGPVRAEAARAAGQDPDPSLSARTPLQAQIAALWHELLGAPVGVEDNFFDLGGTSLLALQLTARIEQAYGVRLSASAWLDHPTVAALAHLIESGSAGRQSASPLLVPIHTEGQLPAFFCVHGFGGGVMGYRDLARLLGHGQPFYGLQARGLDDEAPPHTRIEEMAADYIVAMREQQPTGPYALGGYCYGGIVAYEMARQLTAQGETIALLALMESYAVDRARALSALLRPRGLLSFAANMPRWLRSQVAQRRQAQAGPYAMTAVTDAVRREWDGLGDQDVIGDIVGDGAPVPAAHQRVMAAHVEAMRAYRPPSYPGRVILFRVPAMSLFRSGEPELGWRRLAAGGVEVRAIAGAHNNILFRPQVETLARALRLELDGVSPPVIGRGSGSPDPRTSFTPFTMEETS